MEFDVAYPLYLIANKPFMRIGTLQAAVYWGAMGVYGTTPPFLLGDQEVDVTPTLSNDPYNPDHFIDHYRTITDVVLGIAPFWLRSFTCDIPAGHIIFHADGDRRRFPGKRVRAADAYAGMPIVRGQIEAHDLLLQVDIGDEYSILPPEVLIDREPVGEGSFYLYENDARPTRALLYEVPITLSPKVTITVLARCMSMREVANHGIIGTHGCIGVDIIRSHAVTFEHVHDPRRSGTEPFRHVLHFHT